LETGLIAGDPDGEVTIAWIIAQQVMDLYQLDDPAQGRAAAAELIAALRSCPIGELARLGRTCTPGATSWPPTSPTPTCRTDHREPQTEDKNTKRIAPGYRNFAHYRLRLLLNHGRIREDHSPTRIRTRRPSSLRRATNVRRSITLRPLCALARRARPAMLARQAVWRY
jgi:hypothetical protein